jgi:hypothetical protein
MIALVLCIIGLAFAARLILEIIGRVQIRLLVWRIPRADYISPDNRLIRSRTDTLPAWKGGQTTMSDDGIFSRIARALSGAPSPSLPPVPAAPAIPPVEIDYEDDRVPSGAKERIRRILACLVDAEKAMAREQIPGFTQVDVIQMREQHLPKLVKSYIDIPAEHRSEIFRKTGKSASFILNESLDQMQHKVDEILRNLAQHDIDAFTNNTKFIGQRYSDNNPFD